MNQEEIVMLLGWCVLTLNTNLKQMSKNFAKKFCCRHLAVRQLVIGEIGV